VQSGPLPKTLQKANRFCGRARMATSTVDHGFTEYLPFGLIFCNQNHDKDCLIRPGTSNAIDLFIGMSYGIYNGK